MLFRKGDEMSNHSANGADPEKKTPPVAPPDVPTFPCIVYVRKVDGGMFARVANLEGIELRGHSERELLQKIVPEFKRQVARLHQQDEPIPWIDPIPDPAPDETKRFIPVHL